MTKCSFDGCGNPVRRKTLGLCMGHESQHYRHGRLYPLKGKRPLLPNPDMPGTLLVPLTRGRFAIIDDADGPAVGERNWSAWQDPNSGRAWYAVSGDKPAPGCYKTIKLHRFLWRHWGLLDTPQIDHENTDGLDCRRSNLRAATDSQNKANIGLTARNTSGYKGVYRERRKSYWFAQIVVNGKARYLGSSRDPAEAAAMYERAAREAHGEFARVA